MPLPDSSALNALPASLASYFANIDSTAASHDTVIGNSYTVGGTDVAVADGGTGASTAATARTNLGLGSAAVATLIDDDTMATATATNIPSAESVKAYADSVIGGAGGMVLIGSHVATDDLLTALDVTSIPATYQDLVIVYRVRNAGALVTNWQFRLQVGGASIDTGNNYNWQVQQHDASTTTSTTDASAGGFTNAVAIARAGVDSGSTAGYFAVGEGRILDYATSTYYRHMRGTTDSPAHANRFGGVWKNTTDAIAKVRLQMESTRTFKAGSGLWVYGVG